MHEYSVYWQDLIMVPEIQVHVRAAEDITDDPGSMYHVVHHGYPCRVQRATKFSAEGYIALEMKNLITNLTFTKNFKYNEVILTTGIRKEQVTLVARQGNGRFVLYMNHHNIQVQNVPAHVEPLFRYHMGVTAKAEDDKNLYEACFNIVAWRDNQLRNCVAPLDHWYKPVPKHPNMPELE